MAKSTSQSSGEKKARKPIQRTAFGCMRVIEGRMSELELADRLAVANWFNGKYDTEIMKMQLEPARNGSR